MGHPRRPIRATYRVQVHREFTLDDARRIVPYLAHLGISHLYSSPILAARPGSTHGYDVVDPTRVNPEIGGEGALRRLVEALHAHEMGLVLDIVPNHMGTGPDNPYWEDMLTHGPRSRWAHWFDVDWDTDAGERVVLPILGDELDAVLERGELSVRWDAARGTMRLKYLDNSFPLATATIAEAGAGIEPDSQEGRSRISAILEQQHYRLAFWKRCPDEINYRRFFDVTDLIALRMEDEGVFDAVHARILEWVAEGSLDGLRIDHIDGLLRPRAYLERLRHAVAERADAGFPIFVEKILSPGEQLPTTWPVQGTTGYEALNDIEDVFIDATGFGALEHSYRRLLRASGAPPTFESVALDGKVRILRGALRADVARLVRILEPIAARHEALVTLGGGDPGTEAGAGRGALIDGVVELIACLPVYRTYLEGADGPVEPGDAEVVHRALARAGERGNAHPEVLDLLGGVLLGRDRASDDAERGLRGDFILRFQQTSGPATAKGVEDTALYTYMPLVSRNEVGGAPDRPLEDAVRRFHDANRLRGARWPLALVCTNTHDTKRSADVRARLDVLAEMPEVWWERVRRWQGMNRPHHITLGRRSAPDPNTEYLFYQILMGIWPLGLADGALPSPEAMKAIHERVDAYMLKAGKEGKSRTSWVEPVTEFEEATKRFVNAVLRESPAFLQDFGQFASRVVRPAMWNALARVALHLTVPGTADIYQGDELWNLALVDPDNRRAVDYAAREASLEDVADRSIASMVEHPEDGDVKLALCHALLDARRAHPLLFADGDYAPMTAEGTHAWHVVAFARTLGDEAALVVVPRLAASLVGGRGAPIGANVWGDTTVVLPPGLKGKSWRNVITGERARFAEVARLAELCAQAPVCVALLG